MNDDHVDVWKPRLSPCYTGVLRPDSIQFLFEPVIHQHTAYHYIDSGKTEKNLNEITISAGILYIFYTL